MRVSEISFGCMSLGSDHAVNARLLRKAADRGINLFDTADLYDKGENEITVGKALKEIRQDVFIATKVGNQWRSDGSGWDWNPGKAYILAAVDDSLRRLDTDYIDLYQLHGGTIDDAIDESIEAFEHLKKIGKIRHYGISSIRPNVIREYVKRSNITSVMMQYSLLDRRPEESCLDLLENNNIGVLARGAVAKGYLLGKTPKSYLGHGEDQVRHAAEIVAKMTNTAKRPISVALGYVLNTPAVTTAALGIRTDVQLDEAISAAAKTTIDEETHRTLATEIPAREYQNHR